SYTQAKSSVLVGRRLLLKAGIPFSRPDDYFAETVKSDSHMFKVRQKMADELGALKAADEARRQRELRKFGKKVEMEKLAERKKKKALEEEKIRAFKKNGSRPPPRCRANLRCFRSPSPPPPFPARGGFLPDIVCIGRVFLRVPERKGADLDTANAVGDEFDVALETNDSPRPGKRQKAEQKDKKAHTPNAKRRGKNAKYGFGGKKRGSKSNTAESSANFKGFSLAKNNSTSFGRQGK
ncbi:MAG: eukaryotic rRNA processing protein EBP2-domain-containing protein, partial [Olpidium bornovanus]